MNILNILICDDKADEAAVLDKLLQSSGYDVHTVIVSNAQSAYDYLNDENVVDICIFDILMPDMSGIELAKKLRFGGYKGEIVFLSMSRIYGPESYEVGALSYIMKPPSAESVKSVLSAYIKLRTQTDTSSIQLNLGGATKLLLLREILYVEAILHKTLFCLLDRPEVMVYAKFFDIAQKLEDDPRFIRCHRSYVINMENITEISIKEAIMRNGDHVPIARQHKDLRKKYYQWRFQH